VCYAEILHMRLRSSFKVKVPSHPGIYPPGLSRVTARVNRWHNLTHSCTWTHVVTLQSSFSDPASEWTCLSVDFAVKSLWPHPLKEPAFELSLQSDLSIPTSWLHLPFKVRPWYVLHKLARIVMILGGLQVREVGWRCLHVCGGVLPDSGPLVSGQQLLTTEPTWSIWRIWLHTCKQKGVILYNTHK
jgi:hypothetical protein